MPFAEQKATIDGAKKRSRHRLSMMASLLKAEREGFEPSVPFPVLRFSRPAQSAALSPLREQCGRDSKERSDDQQEFPVRASCNNLARFRECSASSCSRSKSVQDGLCESRRERRRDQLASCCCSGARKRTVIDASSNQAALLLLADRVSLFVFDFVSRKRAMHLVVRWPLSAVCVSRVQLRFSELGERISDAKRPNNIGESHKHL